MCIGTPVACDSCFKNDCRRVYSTTTRVPHTVNPMATTNSNRKNASGWIDGYSNLTRKEREAIEHRAKREAKAAAYLGMDVDYNLHFFSAAEGVAITFDTVVDTEPTIHDLHELSKDVPATQLTWAELISEKHGGRGWRELRMRPAVQEAHEVDR